MTRLAAVNCIRTVNYNFSGGPGALPDPVLRETQRAIAEVPGEGLSVLGLSHRSAWFRDIVDEAEANIRTLLNIPDYYRILFLQGGGTLQFSMIPIAFLRGSAHPAEYLHTGYWSGKAVVEAHREGPVKVLSSGSENFSALPCPGELEHHSKAPYLHYVSNETVEGLQFHRTVGRNDVMRVCDMSSDFLSRPFDITEFALVYAHAQKNLGPAGVTVVILRDDLLARVPNNLPAMLDYREHARAGSIYNTPPVFSIYVTNLVTRWLRHQIGGLKTMDSLSRAKASMLYSVLDASQGFYRGHAAVKDRSLMNVAFRLPTSELEDKFLRDAQGNGFYGLSGHRSIGGIRASIYNAVTLKAVDALCGFMQDFRDLHGCEKGV